MKKLLLSLSLITVGFWAQSQIIFNGISPVAIEGFYDFTYTNPNTGTAWGGDLSAPGFFVQDTLMLVDDGTAADSLGCNDLVNDLTGKIAVIYRGSCNFSTKALKAQNAGALAVIIINNVAGPAVGMAGGVDGASVTIPTVMISQNDGALLKAEMNLGAVVVFIGNISGFYGDNLGIYKDYMQTARSYSTPALTAQSASEFSVGLGAYMINRGSNTRTDAALTVNIDFGGSSVYTETSSFVTLNPGDTSYITFNDFTQANYPVGKYTITYSSQMAATDEYPVDDVLTTDFEITNSTYSLVPLDDQEIPVATSYTRSGTAGLTAFTPCIKYENGNAARIVVEGMYFAASSDSTLDQEEFNLVAYQWDNVFDPSAASYADNFTDLTELSNTIYNINGDLQQTMIYVPFQDELELDNDVKYLFCITPTTNPIINFGFNNAIDYGLNNAVYAESVHPMQVVSTTTAWYSGFTSNQVPAFGLKTADATSLGIFENKTVAGTVYPNPAGNEVTISVKAEGKAVLVVTDISGKIVINRSLSLVNGQAEVNIHDLESGLYIFNIALQDGTSSRMNVVKR
jgi:hypothetical protein